MKIALIAPPFIPVPPICYGGTELFIAHLAEGLADLGHEVVVYSNGESTVHAEVRWLYHDAEWPLTGCMSETLKEMNHTAWAVHEAAQTCDVIHVNSTFGLPPSRFVNVPIVHTIHHAHDSVLSEFYSHYPNINYVTISEFGRQQETMLNVHTIHHGIDVSQYEFRRKKERYLTFLGRLVPVKGAHLAIQVAKQSGIPLKIAGEVQPMFREYFEKEIEPQVDGRFIEYLGEANFETKNELLANSLGFLFPIDWDEPFGLVMIEAMACGTPVLAFPCGSVPEVVKEGLSGYVCASVDDMIARVSDIETLEPKKVRDYVERYFSVQRMARKYARLYSAIVGVQSPGDVQSSGDVTGLAPTEHPVA